MQRERLIDVQRLFLRAATGGGLEPASGLILDAAGVPAADRLAVYADMYRDRLVDSLAEDFPKLWATVGGCRFREIVLAYIALHPPWSWTLRDAGDRLPGFLAGEESCPAWWAELAALEWARIEAFDAADDPALTREHLTVLAPEEYPGLALSPVSSLALLAQSFTVDDAWSRIEEGGDAGLVEAGARTVAIWRRDFVVYHRTLAADEAELLALVMRGCSFAELCGSAAHLVGDARAAARAAELLLAWVQAAVLRAPA